MAQLQRGSRRKAADGQWERFDGGAGNPSVSFLLNNSFKPILNSPSFQRCAFIVFFFDFNCQYRIIGSQQHGSIRRQSWWICSNSTWRSSNATGPRDHLQCTVRRQAHLLYESKQIFFQTSLPYLPLFSSDYQHFGGAAGLSLEINQCATAEYGPEEWSARLKGIHRHWRHHRCIQLGGREHPPWSVRLGMDKNTGRSSQAVRRRMVQEGSRSKTSGCAITCEALQRRWKKPRREETKEEWSNNNRIDLPSFSFHPYSCEICPQSSFPFL